MEASLQLSVYSYVTQMNGLADAHALRLRFYAQHRRWRDTPSPRPTPRAGTDGLRPRVAAHRDGARARQPYRRWTKGLLIERLLAVERAYAEQEERWLRLNDDLLTWQFRAAHPPALPDRVLS